MTKLKTLLNESPMSGYQILIVAICFILNFNDGIDVLVVSYTGGDIVKEWALSQTQLGYIFSSGLFGMTLGCFVLAPLGDSIGRRKAFLISLFLITLGMLCVFGTNAYWQILICRFITGLGIGGILPNLATVASEFSNQKNRDFNVGLIQAGWPLGAILTGFFVAWAIPALGWRACYLIAGLVSLAMFVAVYFIMPESLAFLSNASNSKDKINKLLQKMGHEGFDELPETIETPKKASIADLLTPHFKASTLLLWAGIFFGFLTLYTLMSWVPKIASQRGMSATMAIYVGIALNFGAFSGVIAMGRSINHFGIRKVFTTFMLAAFCFMMFYGNIKVSDLFCLVLIYFIGFFVQGGFNTFYPTATRIYPNEIRATGVGLAMGVGRFGAILGPSLFGYLQDAGLSVDALFSLFSIPLLIAAFLMNKIPSKEVN